MGTKSKSSGKLISGMSMSLAAVLLMLVSCGKKTFYVTSDGTGSEICSSLGEALKNAAEYSASHRGCSIEIIIADGEYSLDGVITIDGADFSAPLTIRAENGAHPVLTGLIGTGPWKELTDPYALKRIPDVGSVLQADLSSVGVTDFGSPIGDMNRIDFYFDGKRQSPAIWPNEGYTKAGKSLGTTPTEYICWPDTCYAEPLLTYTDQRIDNWADEKNPTLHGYWGFDWYDQYNPVQVDRQTKTLHIGGSPSRYGFHTGCPFRGYHLLCELDAPGEYWVDSDTGHIFWYAPDNFDRSSDLNGDRTSVSNFSGEYIFVLNNCTDLTIKGITMTGCRGGAIHVNGGENVTISDCIMNGMANDVITAEGGHGLKILGCHISEIGCSGIILRGGDRETLEHAGFEVSCCTIENLSLYGKTYKPCIRFGGCGLLIAHNCFRNSPSSALRLDGNEILVEYNIFEDLVTESDDQGGVDIFNNYTFRGIEISHNYFHNIGDPTSHWAAGVRFDDRISGIKVLSNIFNYCGSPSGFGAVQIHGGQDNLIAGNVFYDCTMAVSHSPWGKERWEEQNIRDRLFLGLTPGLDSLNESGKLYLERYPDIVHVFDTSLVNVNYVRNNLLVNTGKLTNRSEFLVFENNEIVEGDTKHDFEYWISRETLESKGIEPIDISQMGPGVTISQFHRR